MVLSLPATATADQLTDPLDVPRLPSTKTVVMDGLTIMSNGLAKQINAFSLNLVKMKFNPRTKKGFLTFHTEFSPETYLAIHSDVRVMGRVTRFKTELYVGLFGKKIHVELPEMDIVPQSGWGRQYVELRLPIFYRRF